MTHDHQRAGPDHPPSVLIDQAATLLQLSRRTIYYRIRDGQLQIIRTRGGSQCVLLWSLEQNRKKWRGQAGVWPRNVRDRF